MTDHHDDARSTRMAQRLAQRLEQDEDYLAHLFSVMRSVEGLDDQGLANALGAPLDRLPRIAICRTPRNTMFKEDIHDIAEHFSLDPTRLAQVVRQGQVLTAFSQTYAGGMLAAARDRAAEDRGDYAADDDDVDDADLTADDDQPQTPETGEEKPGGKR